MGRRHFKVPTMIMRRHDGSHEKQMTYTKIRLNWPRSYVKSDWYFVCKDNYRVYLKKGWNLIGQRFNNNILITHSDLVNSCEFLVFISGAKSCVCNVSGNCAYDGDSIDTGGLYELEHESHISVFAPGKAIIFKFYNKIVMKQKLREIHE